jgi:hypothetical protein
MIGNTGILHEIRPYLYTEICKIPHAVDHCALKAVCLRLVAINASVPAYLFSL